MRKTHFARQPFQFWKAAAAVGGCQNPAIITSIPGDVTCPACRETEAWRKAEREARALPLLGVGRG